LHARGIVHRDVAPSNIVLGPEWHATLIDYGQSLEGPGGAPRRGGVVGTPGYVSPEEVLRGGEAVGPAADVYGLAAVGYALFTGRPPAQGEDVLETLAKSNRKPPRPRELGIELPRKLEKALMKGLASDPARRPTPTVFEDVFFRALRTLDAGASDA
jgi:serine/threonine-protein kinase